jgi:hypothetical protein
MPNIKFFMRCVGESPPAYGSRKAYSCVPYDFGGHCCLHYELDGQARIAAFESYQQALTAATIAIFSDYHNFQHVFIRASTGKELCQRFENAQVWLQRQA